eukprot:8410379-Pyramimonas_sp.AAC.1
MGWRPHFQAALPSPGGGTHGGVGGVVQKGIYCKKYLRSALGGAQDFGSGECWFFLELKTHGVSMAIGVIYLISDLGLVGDNLKRLQQVTDFLRMINTPFLLLGDFNMPAVDLHECGFCELVNGVVVEPMNVDFTCDKGSGTMIDYGVISRSLRPYVSMNADLTSSFKTHACLHVHLSLGILSIPVCKRDKPPRFLPAVGPDLPWQVHLLRVPHQQ